MEGISLCLEDYKYIEYPDKREYKKGKLYHFHTYTSYSEGDNIFIFTNKEIREGMWVNSEYIDKNFKILTTSEIRKLKLEKIK